jgi:hypothetical protein
LRFRFIVDPDPLVLADCAEAAEAAEAAEIPDSFERTDMSDKAELRRKALDSCSGSSVGDGLLDEIISGDDFAVRNTGYWLTVKLGWVGGSRGFSGGF